MIYFRTDFRKIKFSKVLKLFFGEYTHCKFPNVLTAMMATPTAEYFEKLLSALLSIIPVISGLISGISGLDNGKLELLHQWMIDVLKTTSKSYPGPDYVFLIFSLNYVRFFFLARKTDTKLQFLNDKIDQNTNFAKLPIAKFFCIMQFFDQ